MKENTKTVERTLTENVREIAQKLGNRYGSLKIVLSAGILALNKLSADEINTLIDQIRTNKLNAGEKPTIMIMRIFEKLAPELTKNQIKILSQDECDLFKQVISGMVPDGDTTDKTRDIKAG